MKTIKVHEATGVISGALLFAAACCSDMGSDVCKPLYALALLTGVVAWHLYCKYVQTKAQRRLNERLRGVRR